jgi:hypothetical protein
MDFKIGDKVLFLDEKGMGYVCGFRGEYVMVRMENDLEIPYLPSQLVKIGHESVKPAQMSEFQNKKQSDKDHALFVVLEPDTKEILRDTSFHFYLVNQSAYSLYVNILQEESLGRYKKIFQCQSGPYQKISIIKLNILHFMEHNRYRFEILFHKSGVEFAPVPPLTETIFLNENKFKELRRVDIPGFFNGVYMFLLKEWNEVQKNEADNFYSTNRASDTIDSSVLEKLKNYAFQGEQVRHVNKTKKLIPKGTLEIDIHFEKINQSRDRMNDAEKLSYQLRFFEEKLNEAITEGYERLVVIHGKGTGRLRKEIIKIAREEYGLRYEDTVHDKYAGGATVILLQ